MLRVVADHCWNDELCVIASLKCNNPKFKPVETIVWNGQVMILHGSWN